MRTEINLEKNMRISRLYDCYGGLLSKRQQEVTGYYYDDDLSLGEIAELCSITRQGVRDAIKKSEQLLCEYEEKLGMVARFEKTGQLVGAAIAEIENIIKTSEPECKKQLCEIIKLLQNAMKTTDE